MNISKDNTEMSQWHSNFFSCSTLFLLSELMHKLFQVRPGGPSVHGGVRDEDGRVCLDEREEEEDLH